ncbi:hypothetical protein GCK32_008618 [Trichostrongylus colubriformis]|uniref:Uncharacterized protein n=1 Tax=Trichostrongylus colubriformis TaxID=6319 RepID=A0AAN8GDR2_TRICO
MMLMILLCFVIQAHSFSRNQDPTSPAPSDKGKAPIDVKPEGPVHGRDRLDDLALAVFNYNVSTIKTLYSLTGNPEAYHDQPVFREWREKYVKTRDYSPEEALYEKVEEVYDNLAMSLYTRSAAVEALIAHWTNQLTTMMLKKKCEAWASRKGQTVESAREEYLCFAEKMIRKYHRHVHRCKWNSEVWSIDY